MEANGAHVITLLWTLSVSVSTSCFNREDLVQNIAYYVF